MAPSSLDDQEENDSVSQPYVPSQQFSSWKSLKTGKFCENFEMQSF